MLTVAMRRADIAVAQLPEEVDFDNAACVRAQCEDLIRQGCRRLVLDASEVRYLDSSGISMIVSLFHALSGLAGTLRLAAVDDHYQQVWRILGLDGLLPLSATVDEALGALVTGSGLPESEVPGRA
ncbi:STAS domain-containing protein [Streptomyces sp. NPDC093094]|uniref:STAS domain-containing protein n=1 Tax=Streptomyces sp. NPDC093094 TaxID=3366026 RepID=UPI003804760E